MIWREFSIWGKTEIAFKRNVNVIKNFRLYIFRISRNFVKMEVHNYELFDETSKKKKYE